MNWDSVSKIGSFIGSKSGLFSIAVGIFSFAGNYAVHTFKVDNTLEWHGKALSRLEETTKSIETHQNAEDVVLAELNGKLSTMNQKLDDDRWSQENWRQRHATESIAKNR